MLIWKSGLKKKTRYLQKIKNYWNFTFQNNILKKSEFEDIFFIITKKLYT